MEYSSRKCRTGIFKMLKLAPIVLALIITGAASVSVHISRCPQRNAVDATVHLGESCFLRCTMEDFDENTQYVSLQKTVRFYHYDKEVTYGPKELYTSHNKFVEEIKSTNRYTETINTQTEIQITFSNAVLGDSGQFRCVVRQKSNNAEFAWTGPAEIPVTGGEVELQFGLRKAGTTGKDIEIVKTFKETVKFEDEDFELENLVYIAEMKGVSFQTPRHKIEVNNSNGDNTRFYFNAKYHTIITNNEDLIPDYQNDITYLYDPTSKEKRDMHLRGEYAYGVLGTSFHVELTIENNSALKSSCSVPMILGGLLLVAYCETFRS